MKNWYANTSYNNQQKKGERHRQKKNCEKKKNDFTQNKSLRRFNKKCIQHASLVQASFN